MTTLTRCLGAAALVGVGFRLGRSRTRWERAAYLHRIADLAGQLEEANQAIELLGQSTLRAWKQTLAAQGRQPGEGFWLPEDQVEQGRANREAN